MALGLSSIPFSGLIYGMWKGKYDFRVLRYSLDFEDLPREFDGFTLTQISDIHSGSFDNKAKVRYAIDLINNQNSDVIFFTGDLVNDRAVELVPWMDIFSKLSAKKGVYSVLGNHDYGDYSKWKSKYEKAQNLKQLKQTQKDLGFDLLLNEHRFLERNGQKISILGVENWGSRGFRQNGDLEKALENAPEEGFKILLSHDPTHWEKKVLGSNIHIHLTLSGHTHGMQFGVEIPGLVKWSPSQWIYKYWAGLYEESGKYLNVNRGLGFIGFPGRAGIWPEISVITLRTKG
ncbi:phosphoesterase [Elysia marginata]|uniref:Phosphoesterase n=1 Tax=Elysia marginata TaxID=1093978 RepID=A0AAV4I3A5_9GAST|nr:phosphoesterase [Elysia marginata]